VACIFEAAHRKVKSYLPDKLDIDPFIGLQAKGQTFLAQCHRSAAHEIKLVPKICPVLMSIPTGRPKP
jgi:hypothetical protein